VDIERIPTKALRRGDLPPTPDVWDEPLVRFALSYDGYKIVGDDLGSACNLVKQMHGTHPRLLDAFSVNGLRMLLFYEQRRARWLDATEVDDYSKAVMERLRKRLPK
jgi:hypothetical protein